jgi:transposase
MDPHKRSATIEVMASDETVVGGGRYGTDAAGYRAMLAEAKRWPERTWAIEGCQGIGTHIANRLLADGQDVVDVPPRLSARTRVFATGQGRKTDATDAHSVALAATRMPGLRRVAGDQQIAVQRILADRRRSLGEDHTSTVPLSSFFNCYASSAVAPDVTRGERWLMACPANGHPHYAHAGARMLTVAARRASPAADGRTAWPRGPQLAVMSRR